MAPGQRRLAAIMFTDMVGWSALAQRDESLALAILEEHRALLRPIFGRFSGREVKTAGDGFLVEFESALAATECGVEIQRVLTARNRSGASRPIQVRVGIHVGDVIHQEGDVLGDAVNIASRIEPLVEAGGVCLSGPVADQVSNKIPFRLLPLEHAFPKNSDSPIAVFEVDLPWHAPPAWQFSGAVLGVQDLRESLRLWTNLAWPAERLRVMMDLGALEAELGDIASVLETYREAQTVATRLGDPGDAGRSRTRVQQLELQLSEARTTDSRREVKRA